MSVWIGLGRSYTRSVLQKGPPIRTMCCIVMFALAATADAQTVVHVDGGQVFTQEDLDAGIFNG